MFPDFDRGKVWDGNVNKARSAFRTVRILETTSIVDSTKNGVGRAEGHGYGKFLESSVVKQINAVLAR